MPELSVQNLQKKFGNKVRALDDVSLDVEAGEFFVLLGPSGSGKTTLIRCVAGLETVDSGTIVIGNRVVTDFPPGERNVAMVFQNYALYPFLTVYENLSFPLKARGRLAKSLREKSVQGTASKLGSVLGFGPVNRQTLKKDIDDRVHRVAKMLQIDELLDRKPGELSGGQRQRVALGRALIREASVYLMDEPLSNLDAKLRASTRIELKHLQKELGITVVYVTHDQVEAMTMSDRIGVINGGKLIQIGKPHDVYNLPEDLFVASFLGDPPINLIEAQVSADDDSSIEYGGYRLAIPGNPKLSAFRGKTLRLGVRPEDVTISKEGAKATIQLIRSIGRTNYISMVLAETQEAVTKVTTEEVNLREGQTVNVLPNTSTLDIFESDTQKLVWSSKKS